MNANYCFFVGRVATTPSLKGVKRADGTETAKVFFRLATTRMSDRGEKGDDRRTNWLPITAWGEPAKRHAQYLAVGTEITVIGEYICETERDEHGKVVREFNEIRAFDIQYGRKSAKNSQPASAVAPSEATIGAAAAGASMQPAPAVAGNPFVV